ncbi:nicotinate-nucleotide--dimethylbenzimidazole phosphoribosyltransferase [Spiractinospora alimapuensis]|uniref:nicotinate-nucleotide--dimethylbenzimidazole phosphoribosyltransferase n=1 Tax=Spiractinospora alimapuensis TaxID=2820884 RepID=UPI001F3A12A4|nr:nicotinate-nucleotide--dimethylbenzimidazole phosphoribosyltransferase [Spiractinospora alimapuensis]QVQ51899.1 nicotinate-nucleotide--dimethylbenzimidazole phosphoribosyltransferase [Spiractinospora alimapuensis]
MSTAENGYLREPNKGPDGAGLGGRDAAQTPGAAGGFGQGGLLDDLPEQGRGLGPAEGKNDTGTVIPFRGPTQPRPASPAPANEAPGGDALAPTPPPPAPEAPAAPAASAPAASAQAPPAPAATPVPATEPTTTPPATPGEPTQQSVGRHAYPDAQRDAVYQAIRDRRDIRSGFRADPVPAEVLTRVLEAAHLAPSVGFSQPWDFLVLDDPETRARIQGLAEHQRDDYARALPGTRAKAFSGLKVEAILDTPLNIAVTVDPTRGGRHTLGRHSQPETASYSAALAVENLWLAARAEGLGVGWVSFFDERELAAELNLPAHLTVVAYLCVGYVEEFPPEPELALGGWARRRPLAWAIHHQRYGRRGLPGHEATSLLRETVGVVEGPAAGAADQARQRLAQMTKPPGSLGVLEEISVQLAGLAEECPPPLPEPAAVAVFAADHGVHAQGVTPWPQAVTAQMVGNFLDGGAVVNAFAAQLGAEVAVVDVGVAGDLPRVPGLLPRKIAHGTADITQGPAMTIAQAEQAIETGIEIARDLVAAGNRCLITGDMGIANTTASAALVCAFTGAEPAAATGRGTGIDDATHAQKVDVVRRALAQNAVDPADPVTTLAALGGFEHAALTGFILGGAALRVPVILDGVIAGAAALAAKAIVPDMVHACFAGHRSSEPGHDLALRSLGLRPLTDLELRLGEGTGALLGLPILQAAARALRDVATFDSAGVTSRN